MHWAELDLHLQLRTLFFFVEPSAFDRFGQFLNGHLPGTVLSSVEDVRITTYHELEGITRLAATDRGGPTRTGLVEGDVQFVDAD